jgi:hypothetical protein
MNTQLEQEQACNRMFRRQNMSFSKSVSGVWKITSDAVGNTLIAVRLDVLLRS